MAETDKPTTQKLLEQQKAEALLRQEIAEAEKATAEAEKARQAAQLPTGAAKPLEGTITADDKFGYIADLTAYDAMMKMADAIAIKINNSSLTPDAAILIVDSLDFFGADVQLLQLAKQLESWQQELQNQNAEIQKLLPQKIESPPGVGAEALSIAASLAMVSGILSATADIVGYFKIDYDVKGRTINLSTIALQSRVAGKIKNHSVHLLHFHRVESSPVVDAFHQCLQQRRDLIVQMAELKSHVIDPLPAQIATLKATIQSAETALTQLISPKDDAKIAELKSTLTQQRTELNNAETAKAQADAASTRAETLIKGFDEFNQLITALPEGKSHSLLTAAAIQNHLNTQKITHLLYLTIASSGGDIIIGKGLFQSGRVRFLGGAVVSYVLAQSDGKIVAADTLAELSDIKVRLNQDYPSMLGAWRGSQK